MGLVFSNPDSKIVRPAHPRSPSVRVHEPAFRPPTIPTPAPGRAPRATALRTVQPRAAATRDALLTAGRALLADRDFDALSIAELAGAIGLSVGSFYGRFRDKEAFFGLLQQHVTEEWRGIADDVLGRLRDAGEGPSRIVARIAATYLELLRRDAGVVRACLKHASTHPGSWSPIHATAQAVSEQVAALLAPRLAHLRAVAPDAAGALRDAAAVRHRHQRGAQRSRPAAAGRSPARARARARDDGLPRAAAAGTRQRLTGHECPTSGARSRGARRRHDTTRRDDSMRRV